MSTRLLLSICTALLLFISSTAAHAGEIYKWVDSQGNSHFSDKPPGADQGHPHVETVLGVPHEIQKRIHELARDGINISAISGDGRQCVITGDSATHVLTAAFAKRLADEGVGTLTSPIPEDASPDHGSEAFELHLSLRKETTDQPQAQR